MQYARVAASNAFDRGQHGTRPNASGCCYHVQRRKTRVTNKCWRSTLHFATVVSASHCCSCCCCSTTLMVAASSLNSTGPFSAQHPRDILAKILVYSILARHARHARFPRELLANFTRMLRECYEENCFREV